MKLIYTLLLVSLGIGLNAQNSYHSGMNKAFELWGKGDSAEAANLFERIGSAETNNWLPYYYAAQLQIVSSFDMADAVLKERQLEKAQEILDKAKQYAEKDNAEVMVLQALLYTSYITLDPSVYGMKLSGTINEIYRKAIDLDPENPRVILSKAEWDMGSARFFGEDPGKYCPEIEHSLELFSNFKPEAEFFPDWGQDRAKMILANNCKK